MSNTKSYGSYTVSSSLQSGPLHSFDVVSRVARKWEATVAGILGRFRFALVGGGQLSMVGTTAATYVRTQAAAAALVNAVLNPLIEWIINRQKGFQPFAGSEGVIVNMALKSIILSVLVALFAARGVHHALAAGHMAADRLAGSARLLLRLPGRPGWLGLLLGIGAAAVVGIAFWLLDVAGVSGVSFFGLLIFKALYCGLLGFGVARWTILRQLRAGE